METQERPVNACKALGQYEQDIKALEVIREEIREASVHYRRRVDEYKESQHMRFMIQLGLKRVRDLQLVERVLVRVVDGWGAPDTDLDLTGRGA